MGTLLNLNENINLRKYFFQDVCRAITKGRCKFPKHILSATTLRLLYRSKQVICMINRCGHCESYDFCLDLELALSSAIERNSSFITPSIVTGDDVLVFHVEWDNLNKMLTTVHGNSVVNSTGGIMIQDTRSSLDMRQAPALVKREFRPVFECAADSLEPLHIASRVGPSFTSEAVFETPTASHFEYNNSLKIYRNWILSRIMGSNYCEQSVSGFGGIISAVGEKPKRVSTIDYFVPIALPFTNYSTIRELLRRSKEVTNKVGQKYGLSTFGFGECMKALPLIWQFPEVYKNHVISPGTFHTVMNYLDLGVVTNRKCRGSGYAEILVESGLVTTGRLDAVLKGKAYATALFCLKSVGKAMERLLVETFLEEESSNIQSLTNVSKFATHICRESLSLLLQEAAYNELLEKLIN